MVGNHMNDLAREKKNRQQGKVDSLKRLSEDEIKDLNSEAKDEIERINKRFGKSLLGKIV